MSGKEVVLDAVEVVAKTALSAIPVGGALITAIYDAVKGNALAKRQERWRTVLEDRLSVVEETLDGIGENELFATAIVKGTELAMKTAQEDKMEYLANAVVNSLKPNLTEEKLIIFLALLDKYTVSHVRIAHFFYNPKAMAGESARSYMMGSPSTALFDVYPELNNNLFSKLYKDLYDDGIINTASPNTTMTGSGMLAKRTTALGDDFLRFILM